MMAFLSGKLRKNKQNNNSNFVNLEPTFDKVSILWPSSDLIPVMC